MHSLNATHDPQRRSWVASANAADTDFPIQNLPYGRFRRAGEARWHLGVALGDQVLDLAAAHVAGLPVHASLAGYDLADFMALDPRLHHQTRVTLSEALTEGSAWAPTLAACLLPQSEAAMGLPCTIRGYTDFFTGIHHAREAGRLFRPDDPLTPNYKHVPIAYHGRTSSIVPSGTPVRRPQGQFSSDGVTAAFGPSQRLDYELEVGVFVGRGNALGEPVPIAQAGEHWFGLVLLNDWSARDVQRWEAQPLGPFLAKNFATSISPWVVTREALAPFRLAAPARADGDPLPLPYLHDAADAQAGGIDLTLEVWLQTPQMTQAERLMQSHFRDAAYWTVAQMVAHHTSNGCNLQVGDLLGTGTQSGPASGQGGCLLELTAGGARPLPLSNGEQRRFLEDGDRVVLRGYCEGAGARRIGFGDCEGRVLPARS
ncbi:MAG: fumarylacetoacetase [Burkholderiaceae bacterium]|nr:fumarylacetoacetase [Burkholderiaceae bacterium]